MPDPIPTPAELAAMRARWFRGLTSHDDLRRLLAAVEALTKDLAADQAHFKECASGVLLEDARRERDALRAQVEALQLKLTKRQGGPCIVDAASCQSAGRCEAEAMSLVPVDPALGPAPEEPTHD